MNLWDVFCAAENFSCQQAALKNILSIFMISEGLRPAMRSSRRVINGQLHTHLSPVFNTLAGFCPRLFSSHRLCQKLSLFSLVSMGVSGGAMHRAPGITVISACTGGAMARGPVLRTYPPEPGQHLPYQYPLYHRDHRSAAYRLSRRCQDL